MAEIPLDYAHRLDRTHPQEGVTDFLWKTYRWMSIGLGLTGAVAWSVANTPSLLEAVSQHPAVFYGAMTQRDLTALRQFLVMGLVGLVIGSLVNLFLQSSALYWFSTYAGVLIFAGLTAYDTQKLRRLYALQGEAGNLALQGALTLYLDFINLFLLLLRIFGKRRE